MAAAAAAKRQPTWRAALLLALCVGGIYSAYLTQGLVCERFSTKRYGASSERFKHLEGLNGAQSLTCFLWAWAILLYLRATGQTSAGDTPAWHSYWMAAISNSIGPACGMYALRNITYSAQILAKSCKMVPVMLMGTVLHGKRYSALEYACMSLIGVGVALFAQQGSKKVPSKLAAPNMPLGYTLCFLNLALDGYTNAAQDEINRKHPRNNPIHMMCWMNFWTSVYYGAYMFGATSMGTELAGFCSRHPDAAWDVALFCLCGALGQLFIFFTIKTFGSLINTLVCTTRKFFSILLSVMWNGSPLLANQWVAVGMVFSGLLVSSLAKAGGRHGRPHKKVD